MIAAFAVASTVCAVPPTVNAEVAAAPHVTAVSASTSTAENVPGWYFGRDTSSVSPFEFRQESPSTGGGSLYVAPITNTRSATPRNDKFIGELFIASSAEDKGLLVSEVTSISFDYKWIEDAGYSWAGKANQLYLNVYVNAAGSAWNNFRDCRFDYVATTGSTTDYTTLTFTPVTVATATAARSGFTCPSSKTVAGMGEGAVIRAIAMNVGDTSAALSDMGLGAFLDNVVVTTTAGSTSYDFEPATYTAELAASTEPQSVAIEADRFGNPAITVGIADAGASVTVTEPTVSGPTPFKLDGSTLVDISAPGTAGPYTICLDGTSPDKLWHFEGGAWVDITDRVIGDATITPITGKICGMTDSLSPFAVSEVKTDLVVVPDNKTVTYGDAAPTFTLSYENAAGDPITPTFETGDTEPSCTAAHYTAGEPVGEYSITCTGGSATNYSFDTTGTATLTVAAYQLAAGAGYYTGQTSYFTKGSSDTTTQVTLVASITTDGLNCAAGMTVADATATFVDHVSGRILARNVPISQIGDDCNQGTAATFATLSTGSYGATGYDIAVRVEGSLQSAPTDSVMVTVATPAAAGKITVAGSLGYLAPYTTSTLTSLGSEGSLTTAMATDDVVTVTGGFTFGKRLTPKGEILLEIPGPNGSTYYVKSNAITSVASTDGITATILAKGSIWQVGAGCFDSSCHNAIDGNVSVRMVVSEVLNGIPSFASVTIQSSKTSALYYSNDWAKSGKTLASRLQDLDGYVGIG